MRLSRVEGRFRPDPSHRSAAGKGGAVASAFPDATAAGIQMLEQGGNAIDAACAVGFALGVCEPQASGIGGQTTALLHFDGRTFAVDGSSRAPSRAHRSRVRRKDIRIGHRGTTVPSTVATFGWMHREYGKLDWQDVLEPAIRIARQGYRVTELQCSLQQRELDAFRAEPSGSGARFFLKDGNPFPEGEIFRQPELADVLECIARGGPEAFYQGDIPLAIDEDMRAHDGLLRAEDLAFIPWPIERRPLKRRYRGYLVASMPPPGAGRTLLLVLMMLGNLKSRFLAQVDPVRCHFLAETFRKAFLQRRDRPFDPNTFPQITDKKMLSRQFARELAGSIASEMDVSLPLTDPLEIEDFPAEELGETTHFSVMDRDGNAATVTQSIELVYGSKAAAGGLGFLYNNYMLAYEYDNPAHPYFLRPNTVPWSSAAPTILFRRKQPWIAVGSPGSERIFSTIGQFIVQVIDSSNPIDVAVAAPRLHCSIGGRVTLEESAFPPEVASYLADLGYKMDCREEHAFYLGCLQAVLKRQSGDGFQAAADPRRDGTAQGLD